MSFSVQRIPVGVGTDLIRTAFGAQTTANTAVTTTTETSGTNVTCTGLPSASVVMVLGYIQLTTGTATTTVTPRIRRTTTVSGGLVGEGNAITIPTAAGSTDIYVIMASETVYQPSPAYNVSIEQAGATGNGTILFASIMVIPTAIF